MKEKIRPVSWTDMVWIIEDIFQRIYMQLGWVDQVFQTKKK